MCKRYFLVLILDQIHRVNIQCHCIHSLAELQQGYISHGPSNFAASASITDSSWAEEKPAMRNFLQFGPPSPPRCLLQAPSLPSLLLSYACINHLHEIELGLNILHPRVFATLRLSLFAQPYFIGFEESH